MLSPIGRVTYKPEIRGHRDIVERTNARLSSRHEEQSCIENTSAGSCNVANNYVYWNEVIGEIILNLEHMSG